MAEGIYKRKRKTGGYTYQAKIRKGKKTVVSRSFDSFAEAKAWHAEMMAKLNRGEYIISSSEDKPLAWWIERWVSEIAPTKKSPLASFQCMARHLLAHSISQIPISKVRPADVIRYRDARLKCVSGKTVLNELAFLSSIFSTARKDWGMEGLQNPVGGIRKPSPGRPRDRRLEPGEEERLLDEARSYGDGMMHDIIIIAIETAMRRGEIASMQWRCVDLRRRIIHLPDTKNGESRDVPLSTRAVEVLQARSKVRDLRESRVFPLRSDAIGLAFRRICKRANIEDLHFHDLRHEATTRLAERLHPLELARVTGHRDTKMLLRYYNPRAEDLARKLG